MISASERIGAVPAHATTCVICGGPPTCVRWHCRLLYGICAAQVAADASVPYAPVERCDVSDCITPATVTTYRGDGGHTRPHHWCATHNPRRGAA